jgi:hypothetical protein
MLRRVFSPVEDYRRFRGTYMLPPQSGQCSLMKKKRPQMYTRLQYPRKRSLSYLSPSETLSSLSCWEGLITGSCTQPNESSPQHTPHSPIINRRGSNSVGKQQWESNYLNIHLNIVLPSTRMSSEVFPSGFATKIWYLFLTSHYALRAQRISLTLTSSPLHHLVKSTNYEDHYKISSILCYVIPLGLKYSPQELPRSKKSFGRH